MAERGSLKAIWYRFDPCMGHHFSLGDNHYMSHIYILPLKDKSSFKVGKSDSPMKRITRLLNFYDININSITIIDCHTTSQSYVFETLIHKMFEHHRIVYEYEGGTEFFNYGVYGDILELCNLICRIKGYSTIPFKIDSSVKILSSVQISTNRFSILVKNKRLELNISQTDLAKTSSVSKRTIERFEKTGQASFKNVLQIFAALGIDDNLFTKISTNPIRKRATKKLMLVGDSDHEPDKDWVQEVTVYE